MKKIIIPLMAIATIMSIGARCNENPVKANATLSVAGYMASEIVSNGVVNEYEKRNELTEMFGNAEKLDTFNAFDVDTQLMDSLVATYDDDDSLITERWGQSYPVTYGQLTSTVANCYMSSVDENCPLPYSFFATEMAPGSVENLVTPFSLIKEKYSCGLLFNDGGEHMPLEFKIQIIDDYSLDELLQFFEDFAVENTVSIPFVKIDGKTLLEMTYDKATNEMQLLTHGIRAWLGVEPGMNDDMRYTGNVYVEIPYQEKIETFETYKWKMYTDEEVGHFEGFDFIEFENIFMEQRTSVRSTDSPILIHDIDFNEGTLWVLTPQAAKKRINTGDITHDHDYVQLKSIQINGEIQLNCTPIRYDPLNYRDRLYSLSLADSAFNYSASASNSFVNTLVNATTDIEFQITKYCYELKEVDSSLKKVLMQKMPGDTTFSRVVIDCENYIAFRFKYISEVKIHSARFDCDVNGWGSYSGINFNCYDNSIDLRVKEIEAISFYYQITSANDAVNHSMALVNDITADVPAIQCLFGAQDISKTDKNTNVTFNLYGTRTLFGMKTSPYDFHVYTPHRFDINFRSIVDFAYLDEEGSIVNCSACSATNYSTAFIDENGKVILQDIDGERQTGYYFDTKTGVLIDPFGKEVDMPINVPQPKDWTSTIKLIAGIAIACLALYAAFALVEKGKKAFR